jgi:hypothetical protein
LFRLFDSIFEFACLDLGGSQVETRARDIFKVERTAVEFNGLAVRLFGHSQLGQLAKSYGDKAFVGELSCSRIPGIAGNTG